MEELPWKIYEFSPTITPAADTRLQLYLGEGESGVTTTLSLCLWFLVTSFQPFNALLSYALNDLDDNSIRIIPRPDFTHVTYQDETFQFGRGNTTSLTPVWWNHACLIVRPGGHLDFHLNGRVSGSTPRNVSTSFPPLSLNGSLVLGQEQDFLDGGYTEQQSFMGKIAMVNVWQNVLTEEEIRTLEDCRRISTPPTLLWGNSNWNVYNSSGSLSFYKGNPCEENRLESYLFFENKVTWIDAFEFTNRFGLSMVVPADAEERDLITGLLKRHRNCTNAFSGGRYVWIGIRYLLAEGNFRDSRNQTPPDFAPWHKKFQKPTFSDTVEQVFVMQGEDGLWNVDDNSAQLCFIARKRRQAEERLFYAYAEDSEGAAALLGNYFDATFVMASLPETQDLYFHGFGKFHILREEGGGDVWCIFRRETLTRRHLKKKNVVEEPILCTKSYQPPVGRARWESPGGSEGGEGVSLALSTCVEDQFTCPDGHCISIDERCDQRFHCSDGFDEMDCFSTTLRHGYVLQLPSEVPLPLSVTVNIWRIGNIDIHKMAVEIDMIVNVEWVDSRLEFRNLHDEVSPVITPKGEKIWTPKLLVRNGISNLNINKEPSSPNKVFVKRKRSGTVQRGEYRKFPGSENSLLEVHFLGTVFHCDFELGDYPFDRQHCLIFFEVLNVGEKAVVFKDNSKVKDFPAFLEEYVVTSCFLQATNFTNLFNVSLHFTRRTDYLLYTTYLPTFLLLGIGYGTLLLPEESFEERGAMSLTTLLVLISLYAESANALPKTTYLKLIDVWFVFCISYLSFVIVVHLSTSHVRRRSHSQNHRILVTDSSSSVLLTVDDFDEILLPKYPKQLKKITIAWEKKDSGGHNLQPLKLEEEDFSRKRRCLRALGRYIKYPSNRAILTFSRISCALILAAFVPFYFNIGKYVV